MKTDDKNITEEIKRIKSLFTEERLWGNLVEQNESEYTQELVDDLENQADEEGNINIKDPNIIQKIKNGIKIASDEVRDRVLNTGLGMKDRKKERQGFAHMTAKEKADGMRKQKTDQRQKKKDTKNHLAACNRGMKTLQKYFLSNNNPKNRMTIETFKGNITGEDFKSRQDSVQECIDTFKGQMKTDKEVIANRTVTEWIKDIIIDEKNTHRNISKEALQGKSASDAPIEVENRYGNKIGQIESIGNNQYKLTGEKNVNYAEKDDISPNVKPFIVKALADKDIDVKDVKLEGEINKQGNKYIFNFSLLNQPLQQGSSNQS